MDFKAGVRMENTSYKGEQLTTNEINRKEYLEWFPTLYLNYKINKQNNLNISYGRRIKKDQVFHCLILLSGILHH